MRDVVVRSCANTMLMRVPSWRRIIAMLKFGWLKPRQAILLLLPCLEDVKENCV